MAPVGAEWRGAVNFPFGPRPPGFCHGMQRTIQTMFAISCSILAGCASTSESAARDEMTAHVGNYPPPVADLGTVRVGVPAFAVVEGVSAEVSRLAADQLTTLAASTQRFDVVERAQLDQLLREQELEGIVAGSELARPAQVRGVDWLLLGKVTGLRIEQAKTGDSFDFGNVPIPGTFGSALGLFGVEKRQTVLKVQCGVDLRLVDPSTGAVVAADFGEFERVGRADAMGLKLLGSRTVAEADASVSADDQGRILRLALDECVRKMLPKVDRELARRGESRGSAALAQGSAPQQE